MNGTAEKTERNGLGTRRVRVPSTSATRKVVSSKEWVAIRDEARVRREARNVLGAQSRWLDTPNPMYGGLRPIDMVRRGNSEMIMNVLASVKYGMFS